MMKQSSTDIRLGLVLVLLLGSLQLDPILCGVHYIVPKTNSSCNADSCLTFSQLADSSTSYANENTTLFIVGGSHYLDREIAVSNVVAIAMIGINSSITCSGLAKFTFAGIGHVHIDGLTFIGCGDNSVTMVDQLIIEHAIFLGRNNSRSSILISGTNAAIIESVFLSNTIGSCRTNVKLFRYLEVVSSTDFLASSCTATVGGALIISNSSLIIDNCHFEGNSANLGGAIFSELESNLTITDSDFIENRAADCDAQLCFGGVLFADETVSVSVFNSYFQNNTSNGDAGVAALLNATLFISQSYIENNSADKYGGALAAFLNSSLTVESTVIYSCTAQLDGGAVYTIDNTILKIINDSKFMKNSGSRYGGVLYAETKTSITLIDCSVLNNTAGMDGGAFYVTDTSNVSITNSIFVYNTALVRGGSIRLRLNSTIMITNSTLNHSKTQSSALAGGGGAISLGDGSHAVIIDSKLYHSVAEKFGGAIHMEYNCTICITDTIFDNNFATDQGGVIDAFDTCNITVYGSIFSSNSVNVSGGVSTIKIGSHFYSKNCSFTNNSARDNGAVFFADEKCQIIIDHCNFTRNSADNGGVLLALRSNDVTIDDSWFSNNTAFTDGGTLHTRINCATTISNSYFIDNIATNNGILVASVSSHITLENSSFSGNQAGHDGGVVYVYDKSTLHINKCNSIGNMAGGSGGVVYGRKNSSIEMFESNISDCTAQLFGGSINIQEDSNATIEVTTFNNSSADTGGVIRAYISSTISITNSTFYRNTANISGGVMAVYRSSTVRVQTTNFTYNMGGYGGVAFIFENSTFVFEQCHFLHNEAEFQGMFNLLQQSTVIVIQSTFKNNTAVSGGVAYIQNSSMVIQSSHFVYNRAIEKGGVIYADEQTILNIYTSNFMNNTGENDGGVMSLLDSSESTIGNCSFTSNNADSNGGVIGIQNSHAIILHSTFNFSMAGSSGGVVRAISSVVIFNNCSFINSNVNSNGGALYARQGSSIIVTASNFFNNTANMSGGVLYLEEQSSAAIYNSVFQLNTANSYGGVIYVTTSSSVNVTKTNFSQNTAERGATISASKESSVAFVNFPDIMGQTSSEGVSQICNNTADIGGGIYLIESTLYFMLEARICNNLAYASGGGMHAINSSITIGNAVNFESNQAMTGGGVSLANSKLYMYDTIDVDTIINVIFVSNHATKYGGALYVADNVDSMCSNNGRCFFQNLTNGIVFKFNNNYADSSGHDLFGGLLDRCSFTDLSKINSSGISHFKELSDLQNIKLNKSVSSEPVRVCSCKNGEPDCSQQQQSIQIRRGDRVMISVIAVDQVNQPVTAVIQSSIDEIALPESQTVLRIGSKCTTLNYDISLPNVGDNHQLTVFADGPCNDEGISKFIVDIHISSCTCPVGFMPTGNRLSGCMCECDKKLSNYITDCNIITKSVIRKGLFWITYFNNTITDNGDYFIYPYCPLDYCQSPNDPIPINLNQHNGSDAQCADNHHGILCGRCQFGYSMSLGGSKCIRCPSKWWYERFMVIIISSLLAGIVLVVILLVLNLTVAIGTINSIIFYANIIYSNRRVYFGQSNFTFIPVFISWLNLDIGIDTCFFEGMDAYTKTWLQLAFPVYIIFLVFTIIWVSSCSSKFSHLLGKRDPVATLATLILISYTKLLEIIIATFSFAKFQFSNHTMSLRWLPDANIEFARGKHIGLICVAVLIFLLCLVYTILIFAWQWVLYCSRAEVCGKWPRYLKLHSFINTYHTPHNAKHRYWTGLLLLLRVILYIVTAVSASSVQPITSLTTAAIMSCLLLYKTVLIIRIYKNWLLNSMEAFVHFNISIYALMTSFTVASPPNKDKEILHVIFSYLSVGTILILLLLVIAYHVFKYGCSCLHPSAQSIKLDKKVRQSSLQDDRSLSINDILDAIDNPRAKSKGTNAPTRTTVSLTNHEESTILVTPSNQSISPEEHSIIIHHDEMEQDTNNSEGNRYLKEFRSFTNKSFNMSTQVVKRAKPKLLYYSAEHNENITKPLLDEDYL